MPLLKKQQTTFAFSSVFIRLLCLKASSYQNVFEWQNAGPEVTATDVDIEVPAFTNWAPSSPSGQGDCVFMTIGGVSKTKQFACSGENKT